MTYLFFAALIAVALSIKFVRYSKDKTTRKEFEKVVGNHPDRPLKIERFDDMDAHLQDNRCPCGGKWMMHSEGSQSSGALRLRVIHAECTRCETETDFFFDLECMQN